jgi:hypothetical protein
LTALRVSPILWIGRPPIKILSYRSDAMSINFTCPHCGATTDVADRYAGQTGPCARCGKTVTVPLPGGGMPFPGDMPPAKRGLGAGWIAAIVIVAVLFVLLTCGGVLLAVLLPAVQAAREASREAARRIVCNCQLKQIGLAMHVYQQNYGCFPPAFVPDKNGKPMHSWRVLLLPFIEGGDGVYKDYRFDEPWDSPHNRALASRMPEVFGCPSDGPRGATTSYAMIVGRHAISDGPTAHALRDITDGASNTIMLVEATQAHINWMEPRDLNVKNMRFQINGNGDPNVAKNEISSPHARGANVLLCDASVHYLSDSVDPKLLEALTTIDGGEGVTPPDF